MMNALTQTLKPLQKCDGAVVKHTWKFLFAVVISKCEERRDIEDQKALTFIHHAGNLNLRSFSRSFIITSHHHAEGLGILLRASNHTGAAYVFRFKNA